MYLKGFTYAGFVILLLWLGSVIGDAMKEDIFGLAVDHEEVIASTSSVPSHLVSFSIPGVFVVMPGFEVEGVAYACYPQDDIE